MDRVNQRMDIVVAKKNNGVVNDGEVRQEGLGWVVVGGVVGKERNGEVCM